VPRLLTLRNVLLMIGAYYLSTWVFFFAWLPFTQLVEGRVYHPGWEDFWMGVFHMVPFALAALAAVSPQACSWRPGDP